MQPEDNGDGDDGPLTFWSVEVKDYCVCYFSCSETLISWEPVIIFFQHKSKIHTPRTHTPAAVVTDWCHLCMLCFHPHLFMSPTPSWPQSKGQIAECPVPSRTHYTTLETDREQRSLCDTAGQRRPDMQYGGGGGGGAGGERGGLFFFFCDD